MRRMFVVEAVDGAGEKYQLWHSANGMEWFMLCGMGCQFVSVEAAHKAFDEYLNSESVKSATHSFLKNFEVKEICQIED